MPKKYYIDTSYNRNNFKQLIPIIASFMFFSLFATGYKNDVTRIIMVALPLAISGLLILLFLAGNSSKLTYFEVNKNGVKTTVVFFIRKHIYWRDIERLGRVTLPAGEGLGMMYEPNINKHFVGRAIRRKIIGWDEVLAPAFSSDGKALLPEAKKMFNQSRKLKV